MVKKIRKPAIPALMISLLLSACAGWSPEQDDGDVVQERVRQPAQQDSVGTQVFPLQNPAVKQLLADAGSAESGGDYDQAMVLLERAMRIQPRDPEILQNMAELQLQMKDYGQAVSFAERSYEVGPRVGEICSRNWRTISVAREYLGDHRGSEQAEERAGACMSTKPKGI